MVMMVLVNFVIIYIIMGNIQVVQSSPKRKNIFQEYRKSLKRQSRSPRVSGTQQHSTHRFSNNNRVYKIKEADGEDTSRHRNSSYYRGTEEKVSRRNNLLQVLEENEPSNGSNRIVNFNDFLIEIKKQMTENSNNYSQPQSQLDQTIKRGLEQDEPRQSEGNRELKLNLKLQNERFELDKYKRLVERELSKSHSIQNITLETKQENEKLLIIKYGQYNKDQRGNQTNIKSSSRMNSSQSNVKTEIANTNLSQKIRYEKNQYAELLKKARAVMKELTDRVESLGQLLDMNEREVFLTMEASGKLLNSDRISRISDLMSDINQLQASQNALQHQIKAAIEVQDESDIYISETLTQKEILKVQRRLQF